MGPRWGSYVHRQQPKLLTTALHRRHAGAIYMQDTYICAATTRQVLHTSTHKQETACCSDPAAPTTEPPLPWRRGGLEMWCAGTCRSVGWDNNNNFRRKARSPSRQYCTQTATPGTPNRMQPACCVVLPGRSGTCTSSTEGSQTPTQPSTPEGGRGVPLTKPSEQAGKTRAREERGTGCSGGDGGFRTPHHTTPVHQYTTPHHVRHATPHHGRQAQAHIPAGQRPRAWPNMQQLLL